MNLRLFFLQFKLATLLTNALCLFLVTGAQAADCGDICDPTFWKSADKKKGLFLNFKMSTLALIFGVMHQSIER